MTLLHSLLGRLSYRSGWSIAAVMMASWPLPGCGPADSNVGDIANLHATVRRQQIEISHLNRSLAEQKAQVEAIHAVGEVRNNVAATRRAIAAKAEAAKTGAGSVVRK